MNLVKKDSSVRTKSDSKLPSALAISSLNKELIIEKFDLLWRLQSTAQPLDFYVRSDGYYFSVSWNTEKLRTSGQDAHINKTYRLGTYCDCQNYTTATGDWSHCISECCITNTNLLGWIQIHKANFLSVTVICTGKHNPKCSSPLKILLRLSTLTLCNTLHNPSAFRPGLQPVLFCDPLNFQLTNTRAQSALNF